MRCVRLIRISNATSYFWKTASPNCLVTRKRIKALKDEILIELNAIGEESIEVGNSIVSLKRTIKENHDASLLQEKMEKEKFEEYTAAVQETKDSVQVKPRKKKKTSVV